MDSAAERDRQIQSDAPIKWTSYKYRRPLSPALDKLFRSKYANEDGITAFDGDMQGTVQVFHGLHVLILYYIRAHTICATYTIAHTICAAYCRLHITYASHMPLTCVTYVSLVY